MTLLRRKVTVAIATCHWSTRHLKVYIWVKFIENAKSQVHLLLALCHEQLLELSRFWSWYSFTPIDLSVSSVPTPDCSGWRISGSRLAVVYVGVEVERVDGGVVSMCTIRIQTTHSRAPSKRGSKSATACSGLPFPIENANPLALSSSRQRTPDELAPFYNLCACETWYIFPLLPLTFSSGKVSLSVQARSCSYR